MLQTVTMTGVDLDSVYSQTLQQIKEQEGDGPRLGMEVLMWVSHAKRPLRIDELCHALAVDMEATDLDPKKIRLQDTVLGSCLGLTIVDKKTSLVRPIHNTLQEYLSRPGILSGAHKILGETCLAYLNCNQVKRLPANNVRDLRHMPFLQYSSSHWVDHAKIELSDRAKALALELLNRSPYHISFSTFFYKTTWPPQYPILRHGFTGLHYACSLGIGALVAGLIEMKKYDINRVDSSCYTPLMWAVTNQNHEAVRLLLTCEGVDLDKPTSSGQTPLLWACSYGDVEMVRLLIEGGANPGNADNDGNTPLMKASRRGDMQIVALFGPQEITMSDLE